MEKGFKFILCVILFVIGVVGSVVEIKRLIDFHHAMTDEAWVGNVLLIVFYVTIATVGTVRAIQLWRKKY